MTDAYMEFVETMRSEGAARNAPALMLGEVVSLRPLCVRAGGTAMKSGLLAPLGMEFNEGDTVAVQRIGEDAVILQKVVEI